MYYGWERESINLKAFQSAAGHQVYVVHTQWSEQFLKSVGNSHIYLKEAGSTIKPTVEIRP